MECYVTVILVVVLIYTTCQWFKYFMLSACYIHYCDEVKQMPSQEELKKLVSKLMSEKGWFKAWLFS